MLADRPAVEATVAEALIAEIMSVLERTDICTVVLTGGTVGIGSLRAVAESADCANVPWDRVRVLWGDERYVPTGHADRNDEQADAALLRQIPLDPSLVVRFPSSDGGLSVDDAAVAFEQELTEVFPAGFSADVALCGIGPDGHVASLFPGFDHGTGTVIAVRNSPKPPPERLSLTFDALNSARKVWIVCAGEDKADAVRRLMNNEADTTPAVLLAGIDETVVFADAAAASELS